MKLIDKSAVVAEIKERQKRNQLDYTPEGSGAFYEDGFIIDIINSLEVKEVKEVDLEKEIYEYMKLHHLHIKDGGRIVFENDDTPNFMCDFRDIAKHFFELGLKAKGVEGICKISETECPNFDEAQGTPITRGL